MKPSTAEEQARFRNVAKGNTVRAFGWTLSSDFECGNGQDLAVHGPDHASFCPEPDIVTEWDDNAYTYFICTRITNEASEARQLNLDVRAPRECFWRGWTAAQRSPLTLINDVHDGADPSAWQLAYPAAAETSEDAVRVPLEVAAGASISVSHHFWYPLSRIEARLRLLAAVRPDVQPTEIGRSAQGRPIAGLRLHPSATNQGGTRGVTPGNASASTPRVVLSGTMQPSEGGHLLCLWALEWLLSDHPAARAAREQFTFDVVPASNPDGIVLGACMVNSLGQYAFYDAGPAVRGEPASVETNAMLRLVAGGLTGDEPPATGYLEYHSTFHTGRPSVAYVLSPEILTDPARRAVYSRASAALRDVASGKQILTGRGASHFSQTLTYVAAERFGTAGFLFKLDTGLGPQAYHAQALEVIERYLEALRGS